MATLYSIINGNIYIYVWLHTILFYAATDAARYTSASLFTPQVGLAPKGPVSDFYIKLPQPPH